MNTPVDFAARLRGSFRGILQWAQLDALWAGLRASPAGWYVCQAGEAAPSAPLDETDLLRFLDELDALLHREHRHDYCGIVYVDDPAAPALIKVYDPGQLGSGCSCSSTPPPPRWILTRHRPEAIADPAAPQVRRRWWQRVLG